MTKPVKWLHAPGHVRSIGPNVIERAVETDALIIDWTEAYFNTRDLTGYASEYYHFVGKRKKKDRRGRIPNHDVVISVRKDVGAKVVHQEEFFVDRAYKMTLKINPERWGKAMVIDWEDTRILAVFWHPQYGAHRRPLIRRGYKKSVERVERVIRRLNSKYGPDLVLAGGDLQLRRGEAWYYPNKMANRLGLKSDNHGIDWQMWSRGWKSEWDRVIDPSKINSGMDHPWRARILEKEA